MERVVSFKPKDYPLQQILELACAAQRVNNEYVKSLEVVYSDDMKVLAYKQPNRTLMQATLGEDKATYSDPLMRPQLLCTTLEDRELANEIQKYYRRLAFAAIEGDNEFLTKVNSILNSETVALNEFGWVACLPSVQARDAAQNKMKKIARTVEPGYLGAIGSQLTDLDCEILESVKSKNFEGYNICAIINNRMCSWINKTNLQLGACVVIKAKVKDYSKHWKHNNDVTRLNYVKAAQ